MNVIIRRSSYAYDRLREDVSEILKCLLTTPLTGKQVLIKPNLLLAARPEAAICTHPYVVRAVVEYVLDQGGHPFIMDSPSLGSFDRILKVTGFKEALADLPVTCRPFTESMAVDCGPPFGSVMLAREAVETDVVINLPKFKTHAQMLLTLGVKNLFGCCVGYRKVEWHLRAGIDRDLFARLLLSIARRVAPDVTLLDGILALEGEGPGHRGHPIPLDLLMGADDPLGIDIVVARLLGLNMAAVPILKVAAAEGIPFAPLEIDGEVERIGYFRLPLSEPCIANMGSGTRVVRKYLLARPMVDENLCCRCDECVKLCPAQAIERRGERLMISYDQCIRCYCCIEICPAGAMMKAEGRAARFVRRVVEYFSP